MLSRRYGHSKDKLTADPTPAGKRFKLQGSSLNIYVPSWCLGEIKSSQLLPGTHTTRNIQHHLQAIDAFLAFHATSTIPVEEIADHMGIAAEQASDDTLSKIIRALQLATPRPDATLLDPKDHRTGLYNKHMHQFQHFPKIHTLKHSSKHTLERNQFLVKFVVHPFQSGPLLNDTCEHTLERNPFLVKSVDQHFPTVPL